MWRAADDPTKLWMFGDIFCGTRLPPSLPDDPNCCHSQKRLFVAHLQQEAPAIINVSSAVCGFMQHLLISFYGLVILRRTTICIKSSCAVGQTFC